MLRLDCWWINILSLKCLPGRASVAHHDAHHRFSNYSRNAKNYGESFVFWDWAFGTLSNTALLRRAGKKKSQGEAPPCLN
jgi:sterol desaturase/sphingolipid hydroxylase (fatty acid hydroxylase superfamily)